MIPFIEPKKFDIGSYSLKEQKRIVREQLRGIKEFNKMVKDNNIISRKRENGYIKITFKNGQEYFCRGYVPENSLILIQE